MIYLLFDNILLSIATKMSGSGSVITWCPGSGSVIQDWRIQGSGSGTNKITEHWKERETHLRCLALVQQRFISRHNDAVHALVELAHRVTSEGKLAMLTEIRMAKDENDIVLFEGYVRSCICKVLIPIFGCLNFKNSYIFLQKFVEASIHEQ